MATISGVAPFLGLFGTVTGLIAAFRGIAESGSGGIATVSGGISEALVTTVIGLFVAIPALWAYNYFMNKIASDAGDWRERYPGVPEVDARPRVLDGHVGPGYAVATQEIFDLIARDYAGFVAATGPLAASPHTLAGVLEPVQKLMTACPPTTVAADYRACDRFDVMDRLAEVDLPVLVIGGADDGLPPVKYADHLVRHIRRAQRCIIPRAGHLAPVEQPAAVNDAIRRFVTRHFS